MRESEPVTILNVDDYAPGLYARSRALRAAGFRVVEGSSGAEALRLAAEHKPALALLDVNMPDMSGLEVCGRLKAEEGMAGTKIVMLTAAAQQDDVARGFAAGADQYLTKPFSPVRLLSLVEHLVPGMDPWRRA